MINQFKTHFGASFSGDLDKSYCKTMNSFENGASVSTVESLADILPKTQLFYKFTNGGWLIGSITLTEDYIILEDGYTNVVHLNDVLGATVKRVNIRFLATAVESKFYYRLRLHLLVKQPKKFSKSHSFKRNYYVIFDNEIL